MSKKMSSKHEIDKDKNSSCDNNVDNASGKDLDTDFEQEQTNPNSENEIIEKLTRENQELQDKILRKIAELDNAIKRNAKEKMELIDYANEKILAQFVNIADDLENAINAGKGSNDIQSLLTGIEMIKNNFDKLLLENGVKKQETAIGMEFDVNQHDAILSIPSDLPEGKIVDIVQNGYIFREKILRHAKVITSAGASQIEKEGTNE